MSDQATGRDLGASLVTGSLLVGVVAAPFLLFAWLGGVRFGAPAGALLGLVAIPILLLFMLKARRARQPVGSLLFWRRVALDQQAQSPFKRLRRNLVLILVLLALAALTVGRAEPIVQANVREGRALVLVIDTSASMLAEDGAEGTTRFAAAQTQALELIDGLGKGDEAALIAVDRGARLVVPLTPDDDALRAGVHGLQARHLGTNLAEGLLLAAQIADAAPQKPEVVLFSDGGGPPPPPVELGGPLRYVRMGTQSDNVGIVARELRATGRKDATLRQVFVSVRSTAKGSRTVLVSLVRGERTLAARRLELPGESERAVSFEERLAPGPLEVRLLPLKADTRLDAFPVDDRAYLVVPAARAPRVALVSEEPAPAWERALLSAGARIEPLPPSGDDPELRLLVFVGDPPKTLPPRDVIVVAPTRPVGPVEPLALVKLPRLSAWNREDPVLRFLDLADLEEGIALARPLHITPNARVTPHVLIQGHVSPAGGAAEAGGQGSLILAAAWREGRARRVVLAFDPHESNWPLKASFPIFVRNALELAIADAELAPGGFPAGATFGVPVALETRTARLSGPKGDRELSAKDGRVELDGLFHAGHYRLDAGTRAVDFGVNLAIPSEGEIAPLDRLEVDLPQIAGAPDRRRPLAVGRWFALLALALLTVEAWAYHRRW